VITDLKPYPEYKDSCLPWFGNIPTHWQILRLRNAVEMRVSTIDKHSKEDEIPVRLCNYVDVYKNERITDRINFLHATASTPEIVRFRLEKGDVLVTKDSEAWDDIGVPALVEYAASDLVCGYHLALLRPRKHLLDSTYLLRALQSSNVTYQFQVAANGVTRFGLSHNAIKSIWLPIPPISEQVVIGRFLDTINTRINRLIRSKRRLINLLNEQKQAIIQRAVTRGQDPDVRLKPSGVEWLGDMPENWEVERIKFLLREVDNRSTTGDETLLSLRMNHGLVPHDEHFRHPGQASTLVGYKLVKPGQVVLNRLQANNGLIFASEISGVVSPDYAVFDPITDVDLQYLTILFRTPLMRHKFRVESKGLGTGTAGFLRLYTDRFGAIQVPLPSVGEQLQIMHELDKILGKLQERIVYIQREIDLVHEYRTRVISDVVTGKIDVYDIQLPVEEEFETIDKFNGEELVDPEKELELEEIPDALD
jgi:type I restriction enzyme S subunit